MFSDIAMTDKKDEEALAKIGFLFMLGLGIVLWFIKPNRAEVLSKPKAKDGLGRPFSSFFPIMLRICRDLVLVVVAANVAIAFQGVGIRDVQLWILLILGLLLMAAVADLTVHRIENR